MKTFIRNRSRNYGNPNDWFPYQATLWFKPEGDETWKHALRRAVGFSLYLKKQLKWSSGALGRIPGIIDTRYQGNSVGILFNHRDFAEEAKTLYKEFMKGRMKNGAC